MFEWHKILGTNVSWIAKLMAENQLLNKDLGIPKIEEKDRLDGGYAYEFGRGNEPWRSEAIIGSDVAARADGTGISSLAAASATRGGMGSRSRSSAAGIGSRRKEGQEPSRVLARDCPWGFPFNRWLAWLAHSFVHSYSRCTRFESISEPRKRIFLGSSLWSLRSLPNASQTIMSHVIRDTHTSRGFENSLPTGRTGTIPSAAVPTDRLGSPLLRGIRWHCGIPNPFLLQVVYRLE